MAGRMRVVSHEVVNARLKQAVTVSTGKTALAAQPNQKQLTWKFPRLSGTRCPAVPGPIPKRRGSLFQYRKLFPQYGVALRIQNRDFASRSGRYRCSRCPAGLAAFAEGVHRQRLPVEFNAVPIDQYQRMRAVGCWCARLLFSSLGMGKCPLAGRTNSTGQGQAARTLGTGFCIARNRRR